MSAVIENHHDDHDHGPDKGLMRWVLATNHKDIGSLYLWFSFAMFLVGGCMALVIRAELFQPGLQLVAPEFFNQMTTMHALSSHHNHNHNTIDSFLRDVEDHSRLLTHSSIDRSQRVFIIAYSTVFDSSLTLASACILHPISAISALWSFRFDRQGPWNVIPSVLFLSSLFHSFT